MKSLFRYFAVCLSLVSCQAFAQFDISESKIAESHSKSSYYVSGNSDKLSYDQFIVSADKAKPVVVYLDGCSGPGKYDYQVRDFFLESGANVIMTDFLARGDAEPSCVYSQGMLIHIGDLKARIQARVKELRHHIKLLNSAGFTKVVVAGHSEGGTAVQFVKLPVAEIIVLNAPCMTTPTQKTLQVISHNDPILVDMGKVILCNNTAKVLTSTVKSHSPLADPSWKPAIREFLGQ